MKKPKTIVRNKQSLIPLFILTNFVAMLLFCSIAIAQKPLDPEYLSKLDMFENLRGLENSWMSGGTSLSVMNAIREMDPNNNLTIVDSKAWAQTIKGGPNLIAIGTNGVAYTLLKSNSHSPAELRDIVANIFKDGLDSFSEKYKKLTEADNLRNYQEMDNYTSSGSGAGYEPGFHSSGIGLQGSFIELEFDPDNQEKRDKIYSGISQYESTVTGTGLNKIKTNTYKRTKERVLVMELREKVVTHGQYILIVRVDMADRAEAPPRAKRDKDGVVQSYGAARPFPEHLWQPILSKLNPAMSTPGKVVQDKIVGNAGKVTTGNVFNETTNKWLKPGDGVSFDDFLTTGDNEVAKITFSFDDAITTIVVKEKSRIHILKRIPKKKCSGVSLVFGRLWSIIKNDINNRKKPYAVETHNSVAGVEGTSFETAYDPNTGETKLSVFEGVVSFECKTSDIPPIMVNAGMQATMGNNCNLNIAIIDPAINTPGKAGWEIDDEPGTIDDKRDGSYLYPIADNYVYAYSYSGWNTANWGKYETLGAGWNPTGGESRAYLKFDLTGIDPNSVNKATLKLYHYHTGGGNAVDLGVYRLLSPWNEGRGTYKPASASLPGELTWNNQPQIDRYPVVYFNPGQGINKWIEVDITSLVKAWLTGIPNYGMAIKGGDNLSGNPESQYGFYSRENEDVGKRPHLVLNGSSSIQTPQGGSGGDEIISEKNSRPWVIGAYNGIHYGTGSAWAEQSGGGRGKDIAVDGNDRPWVIGTDNGIYFHDGNKWVVYPGGGKGIALAVASNGTPWILGTNNRVYRGTGSGWVEQAGGGIGKDIAIDKQGRPWVIGTNDGVFYYDGNRWVEYRGGGRGSKLAISPDGIPWVIGTDKGIYYNAGNRWVEQPGGKMIAKDIAIDDNGRPWILDSQNKIYYHNGNSWLEYPGGGRGLAIAISTNKKLETANLPFFDDFSAGYGNWQVNGQNISLSNGKLFWNTGNSLLTTLKMQIPMENVEVEYDGYCETNGINVYLHNEKDEGYILFLGGWFNAKSGSDVGKVVEEREVVNGKVWVPKQWHHYKVVRCGNLLESFCDGRKIYSRTVTRRFSGMGNLKFSSWQTNVGVDNVKVVACTNNQFASTEGKLLFLNIAGQWLAVQNNGYNGTLNLQQDQSGRITGDAVWNGYLKGIIKGQISGNAVEFTITYPNRNIGIYTYKGTLTQNGTRIINGTAVGDNGVSATWEANK